MSCTYSIPGELEECNNGDPNYWCTHNCFRVYDSIYNNANGILAFSEEGLQTAQENVESLFASNTDSNLPNLVALCLQTTTPGICDTALTRYCTGRELITQSDYDLCGCYVPPDPSLNVSPPCQPLCNLATTVRKATNGVRDTCPANICIIDDVSVEARSSTANVNFTNICPGCRVSSGNETTDCICVVNSSNVNNLLGTVGITTNVTQFCGPQSTCTTVNPDGSLNVEPCTGKIGNLQTNDTAPRYPWLLFAFLGLVLLILFVTLLYLRVKD